MARTTERHVALALPAAGGRLVVVADTHSAPHPGSATHLAALHPAAILHAGDIGDLSVLDALATIAPVYAVRGNIDVHASELTDRLVLDVTCEQGPTLRIFMVHIGLDGPRLRADVDRQARAVDAALVVCGHSHIPFVGQQRGLTLFNPGSIGPRRFQLPILFGSIELSPAGARLAHFEAATGARFDPKRAAADRLAPR